MSPLARKTKLSIIWGSVGFICLLVVGGIWFYQTRIYPLIHAQKELEKIIEEPEELPTAPTFDLLQREILEITFADRHLIEAAVGLAERTKIKGDPPLPSEVFMVTVLTERIEDKVLEADEVDDITRESALITLGPQERPMARQIEGGWLEHMIGEDLFDTYVSLILDNFGRGLDWFAGTEMGVKLTRVNEAALRGDIRPLVEFMRHPKKIGIVLPNLQPITRRFGVEVIAASIVATISISDESAGRILLTCESQTDANKLVDIIEMFRQRSLQILLGPAMDEEAPHLKGSRRPVAAKYIRKIRVSKFGTTVRVAGVAPDIVLRRLIAAVPRIADRLAKTRGIAGGRHAANMYRGMEGPPETVALIKDAKGFNWVEGSRTDTVDNALSPGTP